MASTYPTGYGLNIKGQWYPQMDTIDKYSRILLVGCGGGYDIFAGYFLYKELLRRKKTVILANHSFTDDLHVYSDATVVPITSETKRTKKNKNYFPEHTLASHLNITVYGIRLHSPIEIQYGLARLIDEKKIDLIVAVDAGHDAVLTGEEKQWGSPTEDATMILALRGLTTPSLVVCVSAPTENMDFPLFLQQFARISKHPIWEPPSDDTESFKELLDSTDPVTRSIPNESLLAAMEGRYGQPHYPNPRLNVRAIADDLIEEDYPPVTRETGYHYFFDLTSVIKGSPFYTSLVERYRETEDFRLSLSETMKKFR